MGAGFARPHILIATDWVVEILILCAHAMMCATQGTMP
jgi:hypothetical protein